ncbi:mRNA capping enzyme, beta subunit, structural domain protein [Ophiocordyceps camponoti-floridani]|uniref:mRNA-capping enzyme subunit beta n=1 Tax=Ophiocordyceps camponoti-floridani TaxID=2030778 RepID=A0A8H4QBC3_9HYPO|nr:mRNA capping enzyme, beta subunit, structural domain protein [Ophiocordyceps camponoti-floridani]
MPFHDARSAPSPYRPTPASAVSMAFPFSPAQSSADVKSPVQRHQYPPGPYQHHHLQQQPPQPHPHPPLVPPSLPQQATQRPQHHPPPVFAHQQSPQQQQYLHHHHHHHHQHQRSLSTHSSASASASAPTPTPTSAHPSGLPLPGSSPATASRPSPDFGRQHHSSVAAPSSAWSAAGSFARPPSPQPPTTAQQSTTPDSHYPQSLVAAAAGQRVSSAHGQHDSSPVSDVPGRPVSRPDREHSVSVSPHTRVASLSSNPPSELDRKSSRIVMTTDGAVTPAKRKLQDRSISPHELEHQREARQPPAETNGGHKSVSPATVPRKRRVYGAQPIWAQSGRNVGIKTLKNGNFVLQKRVHFHPNGAKADASPATTATTAAASGRDNRPPAIPSPGTPRTEPAAAPAPQVAAADSGPQNLLGPWEASITGVKPYEEISKTVADFIFIHVVNHPDFQEIASRGIQFEIEAKLGTLIDKDTNCRVDRLLDTESILRDTGRVAFRSSMTEAHHKSFNEFLNQLVIQTDPRAPGGDSRVQVMYKHRREVDRFFDLPADQLGQIPGCMRSRVGARGRSVRVRVTYDQKTREVLNRIIKARVADLDLHMPLCPMDCRLSINLEMAWDGPAEDLQQLGPGHADRNKDRLSYTQGHYQIDLTQVTQTMAGPGNTQRLEKEHELEIELAAGIVVDQGTKALSGAPQRYQELIEGLVDNIRVLARKAREFSR